MFRKLLSLLSDAAVYGISSLLSQLIGFLLLPLYTRYLTPTDVGMLAMLTVIAAMLTPLGNLGMTNAIFRRFNLDKDEQARGRVLATGLASVTFSSLTLLAITCIFAEPICRLTLQDPGATSLLRLSMLSTAITTIGMVPLAILRAGRRVKTTAAVNVSKLLVSVTCTIWLVVVEGQGMWGVVVGTLVGEVSLLVVQLAMTFPQIRAAASLTTWKLMARYGLPLMPHHLQTAVLGMFGQYMVNTMLGQAEGGLYSIAARFAVPVAFVVNAVQNSWLAYKFQVHAEDEDPKAFFSSTFTYYVAGLTYLWIGVCWWGPELLRFMTAPAFHEAAGFVWALTLIPVSQGLYYMSSTGGELSDNTRHYPFVSLVGLAVVVPAAFQFIPALGALGAALATALGWATMACVMYFFSQRRYAIDYDWATVGCFVVLGGISLALCNLSQSAPLTLRIGMAVAVSLTYPLLALGLLLRSRDERGRMMHLLAKFRLAPR